MNEEITDEKWRNKIKSRITSKKVKDLLYDCSAKLTPEDAKTLIDRVFSTEHDLKIFVSTLLVMDKAEAVSGNVELQRTFVNAAARISYVYFDQQSAKGSKLFPIEPSQG
jgi:hypothetical protein